MHTNWLKDELLKQRIPYFYYFFLNLRAEQQRNEALYNAEELSKAFQQYKQKVAEKLEKVREVFVQTLCLVLYNT